MINRAIAALRNPNNDFMKMVIAARTPVMTILLMSRGKRPMPETTAEAIVAEANHQSMIRKHKRASLHGKIR